MLMRKPFENLSRRQILKSFGLGVGASLSGVTWPLNATAQTTKITPRKTARQVIVIQSCGTMSPPDTLDYKETKWTAKDLDMQKISDDLYLSKSIFPNYQIWGPRVAVVRSFYENLLVHFAAQ